MCHLGDDETADLRAPATRGIRAIHVSRSAGHVFSRRADAAGFEISRTLSHRAKLVPTNVEISSSPEQLFGPIVAEFCTRLWLYLSNIPNRDEAVVLFCARGGLNMRLA